MKKIIYVWAVCAAVLFAAACAKQNETAQNNFPQIATLHNSQNSLDWDGVYRGVIPCADCAGIEAALTLNRDGTFKLEYFYIGKGGPVFTDGGTFAWTPDGRNIILDTKTFPRNFQVGENHLRQLDAAGNRITGPLADKYILKKEI